MCWVYKGEGNHTARREFPSRVLFQTNLSVLPVCLTGGTSEQSPALCAGELADTRLLLPALLPGKSKGLLRLQLGCGLSLCFDGEFALWAIIR